MSKEAGATYSGLGLSSILTIIFVLAKIFGKITWSWWWVFSPLLISWGIFGTFLLLILFIGIVTALLE